jgi:HlyD family secretion protein
MATTQIRSKANGTVLEVSVKVGSQVIEAKSFMLKHHCSIADLNSLIFEGEIDRAQGRKNQGRHDMNLIGLCRQEFPR